jgi:tetratricopeptide (TPR) repeat protein
MRKILPSKWMWPLATALSLGFVGCNLFHPTDSRDAENDDAAALTLEGYLEYQNSNYDAARKFFNKAIRADSSYSEAWIGLCKTVIKAQEGINVFELASLAQRYEGPDGKATNGFLVMSDEKADTISRGIDSVMIYLNQFVARDTTDRTDKRYGSVPLPTATPFSS